MTEIQITIRGAGFIIIPLAAVALARIAKDVALRYIELSAAARPKPVISDYQRS